MTCADHPGGSEERWPRHSRIAVMSKASLFVPAGPRYGKPIYDIKEAPVPRTPT